MFVKICGMTSAAAIDAAVRAGADAVGFVFAASPREISPANARALGETIPAHVIRVAVMHHPAPARVAEVLEIVAPDWLQTDLEDLEQLKLPAGVEPLPVVRGASAPSSAARLLFEGAVSGAGRLADWNQARALAANTELVLAGGLNVDNVADAIARVRPWGVDVSSGVERARGEKDPEKIAAFVARVRALEDQQ